MGKAPGAVKVDGPNVSEVAARAQGANSKSSANMAELPRSERVHGCTYAFGTETVVNLSGGASRSAKLTKIRKSTAFEDRPSRQHSRSP